jgi:hypothetical protein
MKSNSMLKLAALALIALNAQLSQPTMASSYETQLREYHEKLLQYQVQPGRFKEQRERVCSNLKVLTKSGKNVDALWRKFDALERRAGGTDAAYSNDCNAFISEVSALGEQHNKEVLSKYESDLAAQSKKAEDIAQQNEKRKQADNDSFFRNYTTPYGSYYNRRQRIVEELKRCHAQKKNISQHLLSLKQIDLARARNSGDIGKMCEELENSLALPHNIQD